MEDSSYRARIESRAPDHRLLWIARFSDTILTKYTILTVKTGGFEPHILVGLEMIRTPPVFWKRVALCAIGDL